MHCSITRERCESEGTLGTGRCEVTVLRTLKTGVLSLVLKTC